MNNKGKFHKIIKYKNIEEPVLGPNKCPTPYCDNLENGFTPTGQCIECVDKEYKKIENKKR